MSFKPKTTTIKVSSIEDMFQTVEFLMKAMKMLITGYWGAGKSYMYMTSPCSPDHILYIIQIEPMASYETQLLYHPKFADGSIKVFDALQYRIEDDNPVPDLEATAAKFEDAIAYLARKKVTECTIAVDSWTSIDKGFTSGFETKADGAGGKGKASNQLRWGNLYAKIAKNLNWPAKADKILFWLVAQIRKKYEGPQPLKHPGFAFLDRIESRVSSEVNHSAQYKGIVRRYDEFSPEDIKRLEGNILGAPDDYHNVFFIEKGPWKTSLSNSGFYGATYSNLLEYTRSQGIYHYSPPGTILEPVRLTTEEENVFEIRQTYTGPDAMDVTDYFVKANHETGELKKV